MLVDKLGFKVRMQWFKKIFFKVSTNNQNIVMSHGSWTRGKYCYVTVWCDEAKLVIFLKHHVPGVLFILYVPQQFVRS